MPLHTQLWRLFLQPEVAHDKTLFEEVRQGEGSVMVHAPNYLICFFSLDYSSVSETLPVLSYSYVYSWLSLTIPINVHSIYMYMYVCMYVCSFPVIWLVQSTNLDIYIYFYSFIHSFIHFHE